MRILVTGSSGFIGSRLVTALEGAGHEVFKIDRKVGQTILTSDFKDLDLIYHLAAQTNVAWSKDNPIPDALDNIMETIYLLTKYPNIKIIYPATASSLHVTEPYGLSKKTAVEYIKLLCKNYVICTLANIWGPGGYGVINKFQEAKVIKIFGNGKKKRTICHVDDVIRGLILAQNWKTGEYMMGGKQTLSIKEIAEKIAIRTGASIEYDLNFKGFIYAVIIPNTTPNWESEIEL